MPLLFYLPLIIWMGLFEVAQDEMRVPVKVKALRGDSTMTERDNGLNRRKVLDIRIGRLVEAHMALICGKVITWVYRLPTLITARGNTPQAKIRSDVLIRRQ